MYYPYYQYPNVIPNQIDYDFQRQQHFGGPPSFSPGSSGFPSFPPGGPSHGFPGQQDNTPGQGSGGPPTSPPPSFTPQLQQSASTFAVDSQSMKRCLYRFTYVWLDNGRGFWFYPTFVGRHSVAGYRWRGFRWTYYGTDANRIRSFQCT